MTVVIEHPKPNYTIEYLTNLPKTAIQIKSIFGHELKYLRYWFDYKNLRVIKKNGKKDKFPFRYMRGPHLHLAIKDCEKSEWNHALLIQSLSKSYKEKILKKE